MRVAHLATLAMLVGGTPMLAQSVLPVSLPSASSRLTPVHTVVPHLRFISEADRLGATGALDSTEAMARLTSEIAKAGMTVGTDATADASLDLIVLCAGPNVGPVGCSVEIHLFALDRSTAVAQAGYQIWGSSRSLFRRSSWSAMAKEIPAIVPQVADELVEASSAGTTRLSLGPITPQP